ncbi:hypothetical protein LTR06_011281 [Exophiala xenobiotica]|nr:hypothetical protein LTR06_011281 [Exophiala xenobiotica]
MAAETSFHPKFIEKWASSKIPRSHPEIPGPECFDDWCTPLPKTMEYNPDEDPTRTSMLIDYLLREVAVDYEDSEVTDINHQLRPYGTCRRDELVDNGRVDAESMRPYVPEAAAELQSPSSKVVSPKTPKRDHAGTVPAICGSDMEASVAKKRREQNRTAHEHTENVECVRSKCLESQLCQANKKVNELRTELQKVKASSARIIAENQKIRALVGQLFRNSFVQVSCNPDMATSSMDSIHTTTDQNLNTFGFSQWTGAGV